MSKEELYKLNDKINNRIFETSDLEIIRYALKNYVNMIYKIEDPIKVAAIGSMWHKVKKLHQQQKYEDKLLEENW